MQMPSENQEEQEQSLIVAPKQVNASEEKPDIMEHSILVQRMVSDQEEFLNFGDQKSQACSIF